MQLFVTRHTIYRSLFLRLSPPSQKLQPPSDLINNTLRRRPNPQYRMASARDLRPPGICDDLRY
jgi:hypothetical protein